MSHRHISRPSDRDVRMQDPPAPGHPHLMAHPPQAQPHPPHHMNGNSSIPPASGPISNGSNTISPTVVASSVPSGVHPPPSSSIIHKLNIANEKTWLLIGRVAEQMGDLEHALSAYENALRHNPMSLSGLTQVAGIARIKENYPKAIDYFQRVLGLQEENGEVWSALGHCYLMQDDLQKAYSAYQQALYLLPNPKEDPKLWYGIGILYDRYGSLDHAEEAFSSVLRMDKDLDFDKANEILFRLGIIYKQQGKYEDSLGCFDRILRNPPSPLAHADIWFQIGHVYEQQKNHVSAKDAYERVVADNPGHAKVLQQLGWLYHQDGSSFQNQDLAIQYLTKSLEADPSDAQSWYLLGRAYMAGQKYNKAYEAYQQAVYRDGRNPTFWCSIGVLYFQINQFRDALDAYSRAIRINPYISEVWFDLGSLYESCNNQITDAIDAYARASELDPNNPAISQRLQLLKTAQATGGQLPAAPGPQDVHPTAYASAVVPPPGLNGPPLLLQSASHRPVFRTDSRGPSAEMPLPPPQANSGTQSSPPFRGGPPPPVILDDSRHIPSHTPLAPMEVDRPPPHGRDYAHREREVPSRGPVSHHNLLLQHPPPQQHPTSDDPRNGGHQHYFRRPRSRSPTPPSHNNHSRSPLAFQSYPPPGRQAVGPAQPSATPPQHSPRPHPSVDHTRPAEPDSNWDRRVPLNQRDWDRAERERRPRHDGEYPPPASTHQPFYTPRSPGGHLPHSPSERSPRPQVPRYWDSKNAGGPPHSHTHRPSPPPPLHHEGSSRRYDPRYDARDAREYGSDIRGYPGSPEGMRGSMRNPPPPHLAMGNNRRSESPHPSSHLPDLKDRRRRSTKEKDLEMQPQNQGLPHPQLPPSQTPVIQDPSKKERRKRGLHKRPKEEQGESETPKTFGAASPEPASSNGSGSSRSVQPSPTAAAARPPSRVVDEDYDEGVADALMGLASYRAPELAAPSDGPTHSPTISSGSRHSDPSPRPLQSHRNSVSSTRSHASPTLQATQLKRARSPGSEESDNKRSRMENRVEVKHRVSSTSIEGRTPVPSTRPSPIPFRTQPHSPEARQPHDYPPSPPLPAVVLPPHPRPIGAGLSQTHGSGSTSLALPPIATLSPTSTAPSPSAHGDHERMQVDGNRSASPPSRVKLPDMTPSLRSPKHTPSPSSDKKEAA